MLSSVHRSKRVTKLFEFALFHPVDIGQIEHVVLIMEDMLVVTLNSVGLSMSRQPWLHSGRRASIRPRQHRTRLALPIFILTSPTLPTLTIRPTPHPGSPELNVHLPNVGKRPPCLVLYPLYMLIDIEVELMEIRELKRQCRVTRRKLRLPVADRASSSPTSSTHGMPDSCLYSTCSIE